MLYRSDHLSDHCFPVPGFRNLARQGSYVELTTLHSAHLPHLPQAEEKSQATSLAHSMAGSRIITALVMTLAIMLEPSASFAFGSDLNTASPTINSRTDIRNVEPQPTQILKCQGFAEDGDGEITILIDFKNKEITQIATMEYQDLGEASEAIKMKTVKQSLYDAWPVGVYAGAGENGTAGSLVIFGNAGSDISSYFGSYTRVSNSRVEIFVVSCQTPETPPYSWNQ